MLNKDRFFARKDILELVNKRVLSFIQGYRQNITILGDELVGKTATIRYYLDKHLPPEIIPIYITLDSLETDCFAKSFCGSLLHNFLRSKGIRPSGEIDYLIAKSQDYIPQTVALVKNIIGNIEKQKEENIFQMILDLPAVFTKETKSLCLLIFDEFHNLEDLEIKDVFKELGKRIMLQKEVMYVLISSLTARSKRIVEDKLSLLFGNFEIVELEPFDSKIASEFIAQNTPNINITSIYKDFIINLCGGMPYYLDVICQELIFIAKLKEKTTLALEDIIEVLENLLFNPLGILNMRFNSKLYVAASFKNTSRIIDILLTLSSASTKLKDIAIALNRPQKDILQKLNRLAEMNLISQNGSFYKINDKMFSLWLRSVYKLRRNSFVYDTDSLRDNFKKELQLIFDILIEASRKKSTERVIELFNLFEDESVLVERRRIRLTDFKEIRFFGFDANNMRMLIIAKDKQDTLWMTFVKEDMVTEEDVIEFSRHLHNNESKIKRKIVIGLSNIDPNARLKALRENMLIWDRRSINELFDLYGKPML